jgi:hypothetical protein
MMFWIEAPCSLVGSSQCFREARCPILRVTNQSTWCPNIDIDDDSDDDNDDYHSSSITAIDVKTSHLTDCFTFLRLSFQRKNTMFTSKTGLYCIYRAIKINILQLNITNKSVMMTKPYFIVFWHMTGTTGYVSTQYNKFLKLTASV